MLKKIIGTTGTRILNAAFNLVILIVITNKIGSEGLGIIGLILVDITIIQLSVDLIAGGSLVYFASRANIAQLLIPAYVFVAVVLVIYYLLGLLGATYFPVIFFTIVPEGYFNHILALSAIGSLMWIHYNLLLGKARIAVYNLIFTIQISVFLGVFMYLVFIIANQSVEAYILALLFAYGIATILGFIAVMVKTGKLKLSGWFDVTKQVFKYGLIALMANLLSIGNNRLSFFFIKYFSGLSALGIFNAGIQTTEGFKLIGQSIAVVQFSAISNTRDVEYSRILTIRLMKVSVLITLAAVIVINILPESFYTWMFSDDFIGVKPVIIALSPGVMALAANNIFSHYFSGMGAPKINLYAKIIGFIFTVILAVLLIPPFGFIGAAITASISYTSTVIYQYIVFARETKTKLREWIPANADFTDLKRIIRESFPKN
jgi:O-antigen/teichoic acid export membrane protein